MSTPSGPGKYYFYPRSALNENETIAYRLLAAAKVEGAPTRVCIALRYLAKEILHARGASGGGWTRDVIAAALAPSPACDQANPGHTHDTTAWQIWQRQSLGDPMNDPTLASAEHRVQQMATSYRAMPGQEMPTVGRDLQAVLDELARLRAVETAAQELLTDIDRAGCVYDYEISDDTRAVFAAPSLPIPTPTRKEGS